MTDPTAAPTPAAVKKPRVAGPVGGNDAGPSGEPALILKMLHNELDGVEKGEHEEWERTIAEAQKIHKLMCADNKAAARKTMHVYREIRMLSDSALTGNME